MPYELAPNIELMFTEAGPDPRDRVRAATAAGFEAVEMWTSLDKDVPALRAVLDETGARLVSMLAEPRTNFTWPGTDLQPFFDGLARGVDNAQVLGCPRIVLGSGIGFPGSKRQPQLERLVEVFTEAAERSAGSGVQLILEPVNIRVDHPGALLDRTAEAVAVVRGVGSESFGLLYDLYHSVTEGEDPQQELANAAGVVDYVQLADVPGRGEPGSGSVDWPAVLRVLRASGYDGPIGLEYVPTGDSVSSVEAIRGIAASV